MSKLPVISGRDAVRAVERIGSPSATLERLVTVIPLLRAPAGVGDEGADLRLVEAVGGAGGGPLTSRGCKPIAERWVPHCGRLVKGGDDVLFHHDPGHAAPPKAGIAARSGSAGEPRRVPDERAHVVGAEEEGELADLAAANRPATADL